MPIEGSKAKYIRDLLDKALELSVPQVSVEEFERLFGLKATADEIKNLSFAEVMVRQLVMKACSGNDKSIQEILDRLLGKAVQTTENTTKSYSYHDFLIECRNQDTIEAGPKKTISPPAKSVLFSVDECDIMADFL